MTDVHRYPESEMPFACSPNDAPVDGSTRFLDLRESLLLNYRYNTARAYWADLQDWFDWSMQRDKDVLNLTEGDVKQYCALMRRRQYSESTIRRRMTSLRALLALASESEHQ